MQLTTFLGCLMTLETFICVVNTTHLGIPFTLPFVLPLHQFIMSYDLRKEHLKSEINISELVSTKIKQQHIHSQKDYYGK